MLKTTILCLTQRHLTSHCFLCFALLHHTLPRSTIFGETLLSSQNFTWQNHARLHSAWLYVTMLNHALLSLLYFT